MPDKTAKPSVTEFNFAHPALCLPNSFFALSHGEPVLQVDLGDARGAIPLRQVAQMFSISPESGDGQLLGMVAQSLRFVRIIQNGDRIPSEIVDGTASWTIESRHRDLAFIKIGGSLLKAIAGARADATATLDESEEAKRRMREQAAEIAALVGVAVERKQEVVDRVEVLANELAFLEALREYFKPVFDIGRKLREMQKLARGDRELDHQLRRIQSLLKVPVEKYRAWFDEVEAGTGEAVAALKQFEGTVAMLRRHRDNLHFETLAWEDLPQRWKALDPAKDEAMLEIGRLYRFLASRYLDTKVWFGG
ncbi:hypothetical protein [Nitrospirillum sp. BR 11163]|uniref:hypothetical protein n=1 Tax=Nitrospirillum sp. BR 11163 TaxID=3104323 RepID=UPI002AFDFFA5|nr:hypothetical protein [Nitrospirillum sp. BR 11163]MEA1676898.1 hypothetical protein [Nitrospirillum sp. BR 11163]